MTFKLKKILSLVLAIVIFSCAIPSVSAASPNGVVKFSDVESPKRFNSAPSAVQSLSQLVDIEQFRTYLFNQFKTCPDEVDISFFNIPYSENNAALVREYIWNNMPESFHVDALSIGYYDGGNINSVLANYFYDATTYSRKYTEMVASADRILQGIEDNPDLTDIEKALLIHDRLGVWNEYDIPGFNSQTLTVEDYSPYGALVNRQSVCDGYTAAYIYLLRRAGIKSEYCSSETLHHSWNIVYINNIPYHVDVTWDDNGYLDGYISHDNFLRSTNGIKSTGHNATDFNTAPQDTTYDSYFWQSSKTEMQLIDNEIYYIDNDLPANNSYYIRKYNNGELTKLLRVSYAWKAEGGGIWGGHFGYLSSVGDLLLYSLGDGVYSFNPKTDTNATKIFTPLTITETNLIYGFTYHGNYLICNIANTANCVDTSLTNHKLYTTVKQYYTSENTTGAPLPPTLVSKDFQSVTLEKIKGYEYKVNDGEWQKSNVFTGLLPNTEYSFYQRRAETTTTLASASSGALRVTTSRKFADVSTDGWYYGAVKFVTDNGYFSGYAGTDLFGTSDSIQRQDFLVMLARLDGADLTEYQGRASLSDVSADSYYAAAVAWGVEKRITTGYDDGRFGVGDKITREQLVTFLCRYARYKGVATDYSPSTEDTVSENYTDYINVSAFSKDSVLWAIEKRVISGKDPKTIAPQGDAQRCEVAQIIYNSFNAGILQ